MNKINETTHEYCAQGEPIKTRILHRQLVQDSCQRVRVLSQISLCFSRFGFKLWNEYALMIANN